MTPSSIRVFGFGGAGCRFVDDLRASAGDRLGAWVADTDVSVLSALRAVPRECRHTIGDNQFVSGSGGDVARVRATALAENEVFRAALDGVALAVAVAGLGGGTGGGALPVFLEAARERNVRTIVFAVKPFRFEGVERLRAASSAAQTLATLGDIRVFPSNDDLAGAGDGDPSADEALSRASARASRSSGACAPIPGSSTSTPGRSAPSPRKAAAKPISPSPRRRKGTGFPPCFRRSGTRPAPACGAAPLPPAPRSSA